VQPLEVFLDEGALDGGARFPSASAVIVRDAAAVSEQIEELIHELTLQPDFQLEPSVSRALVSLVLQGSPKGSEQKRQAVARAMAALDYRPGSAARSLASGRTRIVGVLLDDLANPWFVELLDGLQTMFGEKNLQMVLGDPRYLARPGGKPGVPVHGHACRRTHHRRRHTA
jgi:hypothetical protein